MLRHPVKCTLFAGENPKSEKARKANGTGWANLGLSILETMLSGLELAVFLEVPPKLHRGNRMHCMDQKPILLVTA